MPYYHYKQNNSGGDFDITDELNVHTIIKADNADDADAKLQSLGGYFNGVQDGVDCECCGDRWYRTSEDDARDFPHIYGEPITNMSDHRYTIHE